MQLYFKEFGHGQPLILLHGLLGSLDNWLGVAPKLAEKFHVFALDQRNHGLSPHSSEMNYPVMARDVDKFFDAQKIESAFVIGHSLGGKTAMQFALQFSERVDKLVVEDIAPRKYESVHIGILEALLALDLKSFSTRQEIEDALAPQIPGLAMRRFLLKNLSRAADGKFFWKANLRGIAENYPAFGEAISTSTSFAKPSLFIRGEKSNYVKPEDEALIRQIFPQARMEMIAGANHWVHGEKPEDFLKLVLDFL